MMIAPKVTIPNKKSVQACARKLPRLCAQALVLYTALAHRAACARHQRGHWLAYSVPRVRGLGAGSQQTLCERLLFLNYVSLYL